MNRNLNAAQFAESNNIRIRSGPSAATLFVEFQKITFFSRIVDLVVELITSITRLVSTMLGADEFIIT